jgi:hypothetical protein
MKWLAVILNFAFSGAGYLVYKHKIPQALMWTIGALLLTYVEQVHTFADGTTLVAHDPTLFKVLFATVFLINTAFAIDVYQVATEKEATS